MSNHGTKLDSSLVDGDELVQYWKKLLCLWYNKIFNAWKHSIDV